jgi:flagellin-specific chaperone FliS
MELFEFELPKKKSEIQDININRVSVFLTDEQKKEIEKNLKKIYKKYNVDNLTDYFLIKIYEDIRS